MRALVKVSIRSRSICVEVRPDSGSGQLHPVLHHAFAHLNGAPRRCPYDNATVVTTGRYEDDRTDRDRSMLDFAGERVNSATPA